jgi:hypothetical protein
MTLGEYIKKRNGVAMGSSHSFRNNLYRSLGAKNFSTFWNYWNPIFGYYLGKRIFKPLRKYVPPAVALLITFLFCGLLHDAVTTIFRGNVSFFFSIWFVLMAVSVLVTRWLKQDFSTKPWLFRACANMAIISSCLLVTNYLYALIGGLFQV